MGFLCEQCVLSQTPLQQINESNFSHGRNFDTGWQSFPLCTFPVLRLFSTSRYLLMPSGLAAGRQKGAVWLQPVSGSALVPNRRASSKHASSLDQLDARVYRRRARSRDCLPTGMSKPGTPHLQQRPSAADKSNNREERSVTASQECPKTPPSLP